MEHLEGLLKLVDREFGEMEQIGKFRNKEDVEIAYKLMDIAKDVQEYWECEAKLQGGYSEYGYGYPMGNYPMNEGMSYARGGNMQRNSMGQFTSRDGGYGYNYGGNYANANDAKSAYLKDLYALLRKAPDDRTREHIQNMIHETEQSM